MTVTVTKLPFFTTNRLCHELSSLSGIAPTSPTDLTCLMYVYVGFISKLALSWYIYFSFHWYLNFWLPKFYSSSWYLIECYSCVWTLCQIVDICENYCQNFDESCTESTSFFQGKWSSLWCWFFLQKYHSIYLGILWFAILKSICVNYTVRIWILKSWYWLPILHTPHPGARRDDRCN